MPLRFLMLVFLFSFPVLAKADVTFEEAHDIALAKESGHVVETETKQKGERKVYEFEIEKRDGTVMEVQVDGKTGEIVGHKIDKLAPGASLPKPSVMEGDAKAIAMRHVQSMSQEKRKPGIKEVKYTLVDGNPAYEVDLKRQFDEVVVFVDAMSGDIISAEIDD